MIFSRIIIILLLFPLLIQSFDDSWESVSVNTGETATFICDLPERYSNKPAEFYGPMGRLLVTKTGDSDDRTRFMLEHTYAWTWSFILSDVSDDDAGEYTCRISSDDRTLTIIKRFNLTVLTPPKIVDITIESNMNNNGILLENQQVILKCTVRGNPQPKIFWNISERKRNDRNIIPYDNKLLIRNFSRISPTNYQCIADNGIPPRDTRTRHLVPAILPEITIQLSLSRFSSQIIFNCTIVSRPLVSAKWRRYGSELSNVKRVDMNDYTIHLIFSLQIDPTNYTNTFGMYECEAENQFKITKSFIIVDDSTLSNITTSKQQRISSSTSSPPSYDMALFISCGNRSSFSTQFYILALIAVILLCFCSYCSSSSSSIHSPVIEINPLSEFTNDDESYYYLPLRRPSHRYIDIPEQFIIPTTKNRFVRLLIKSSAIQPSHRYKQPNNKRYSAQAFHAMRG